MPHAALANLVQGDDGTFAAEFLLHGGHAAPSDPARHDGSEAAQVRVHVDGQPVHGDPATDAHADRANLVLADPGAVEPCRTLRADAVVGAAADHDFLQILHVAAYVFTIRLQIEDGV